MPSEAQDSPATRFLYVESIFIPWLKMELKMADFYRCTFTFEGKRYFVKGKTQREADQKAALRKADMEAGRVAASKKTVAEWWPEYLETYHPKASDGTLVLYDSIYRHAIAPEIGPRALKSVRSADLQRILNNLSTRSESYAKKAIFLLKGLFRTAVSNELIPKSPAEDLILPSSQAPTERRALTPAERDLFLAAAPLCGQAGLFHLVIYHTGLRPSEASRIEARDVNMKTRTLTVRGTKTKAAVRQVPIPAALELPTFSGRLFSTSHGCAPTKTARALWWKKIAAKMEEISGEPVAPDLVPYDLRHDYCTRLSEKNVPIEIASKIMGHSSIALTARIYHHNTDSTLDIARALIDA